jgi:hypothetical protein
LDHAILKASIDAEFISLDAEDQVRLKWLNQSQCTNSCYETWCVFGMSSSEMLKNFMRQESVAVTIAELPARPT